MLPGAMLIAAVALLEAIGAVSPLFAPVLRAFILAIGFVQVGLLLGRPLVYLGLWLFALVCAYGRVVFGLLRCCTGRNGRH